MSNMTMKPQKPMPPHDAVCPYCQRRFDTPDALTLHIVTRHTQIGVRRSAAGAGSGK
jgi:hypothetical protein